MAVSANHYGTGHGPWALALLALALVLALDPGTGHWRCGLALADDRPWACALLGRGRGPESCQLALAHPGLRARRASGFFETSQLF